MARSVWKGPFIEKSLLGKIELRRWLVLALTGLGCITWTPQIPMAYAAIASIWRLHGGPCGFYVGYAASRLLPDIIGGRARQLGQRAAEAAEYAKIRHALEGPGGVSLEL